MKTILCKLVLKTQRFCFDALADNTILKYSRNSKGIFDGWTNLENTGIYEELFKFTVLLSQIKNDVHS